MSGTNKCVMWNFIIWTEISFLISKKKGKKKQINEFGTYWGDNRVHNYNF